jgi:hypothetical protein
MSFKSEVGTDIICRRTADVAIYRVCTEVESKDLPLCLHISIHHTSFMTGYANTNPQSPITNPKNETYPSF